MNALRITNILLAAAIVLYVAHTALLVVLAYTSTGTVLLVAQCTYVLTVAALVVAFSANMRAIRNAPIR